MIQLLKKRNFSYYCFYWNYMPELIFFSMESFQSTVSIWCLNHKPTIKTTIRSICLVLFSIFVWKMFCRLLSKYLWQNLFLVKSYVFSILFWTPIDWGVWIMEILVSGKSYFRRLNNIQTTFRQTPSQNVW